MDSQCTDSNHRIVSSQADELILVDDDDRETGFLSKAQCHDGAGVLHRAFSVFLFNEAGELLLQQRSDSKRLWPGYWSNTCCSHPRRGESMQVATRRRLREELDIEAALEFVYKFSYQAQFGASGSEHELCHVFLGKARDVVRPNGHEIAAIRYLSAADLLIEFERAPEHHTPWFQMEWQALLNKYRRLLAKYCEL